jgi:assimilatory nitrate reductase catalytic subunit
MFDAIKAGEIKAVWIACTNPAHSMPDLNSVLDALKAAELVVLQDAFNNTDSNQYADVFFPASTWGEKEGTVTNSERRITRILPAANKAGEARHDWEIAVDFAQRLEKKLGKTKALFDYPTTESVFNEHRETTRGRDLDITGLSYQLLEQQGPQQWPFKEGQTTGQARLYTDGIFQKPNGKAQFHHAVYKGTADKTDARHPLHLLTGRLRDQWHGMSRTGTIAQLYNHADEPIMSMNKDDMMRRQLKTGDIVKLSNKRGHLTIRVAQSEEVKPAETFVPMHWGRQFMNGLGVNALMPAAFDKTSKQPELKHTAIKVEKLDLP